MDYANPNAVAAVPALAATGAAVTGLLWLAIGLVALAGLAFCFMRFIPKSEDN